VGRSKSESVVDVPDGERRVTNDALACNSQNTEITDYTVTTRIIQQRFLLICVVSVASVISVFWLLPLLLLLPLPLLLLLPLPLPLRSLPFVCRLSHDEP
jgi:hypothetical protein